MSEPKVSAGHPRKEKGRKRELRARKMLEACGFMVVRAAGSHGLFDLVAVSSKHIKLIQVKTNRKPPPAEMEELRAFRAPRCCATKEVWTFYDGTKEPFIEEIG
ncbi:MAG: hypothetical protein RX318_03770 [bacterium]|nr:hypothetical protein [bacterium]